MNKLTNLYKILSDETRLRMMVLLSKETLCVCQLEKIMELTQPKISKHLSKLKDLGWVTDQRQEKFIFYSLNQDPLLKDMISFIVRHQSQYPQLQKDDARLRNKNNYLNIVQSKGESLC